MDGEGSRLAQRRAYLTHSLHPRGGETHSSAMLAVALADAAGVVMRSQHVSATVIMSLPHAAD